MTESELINKVARASTEALKLIRHNGFVFQTDLTKQDLTESERWERLALSLYSRMVELSNSAQQVLENNDD